MPPPILPEKLFTKKRSFAGEEESKEKERSGGENKSEEDVPRIKRKTKKEEKVDRKARVFCYQFSIPSYSIRVWSTVS